MPIDVDFSTIRPWGRGQDIAFEELCCQVARAAALQQGQSYVRLGTPDGGVEGYSIDADGAEHGLQAKFFLGSPGADQWSKITSSVKTALEKHPKLTVMTIALPSDRADPRKPGEQWFMDKWDYYVEQWERQPRPWDVQSRFASWASPRSSKRCRGRNMPVGSAGGSSEHYSAAHGWLNDSTR